MKTKPVSTYRQLARTFRRWPARLGVMVAYVFMTLALMAFPNITNVVETGGDNEPTDTVTAKWTGVTFTNGVPGEFLDPYTVPLFDNGVPAYVDRTHTWKWFTNGLGQPVSLPYLQGAEYIMIGNDNRDNTNLVLDIYLAVPSRVYLLVDNRLGEATPNANDPPVFGPNNMQWLVTNGWVAVMNGLNRAGRADWPDEVANDNNNDGSLNDFMSVYVKTVPAGLVKTFGPDNGGRASYGVVIAQALPAPSITVQRRDGALRLSWAPVSGASSYNIQRATTAGGPYTLITNTTQTALLDTGLVNGTTYYYIINAASALGEGFYSAEVSGLPLAAVADLTATYNNGQVDLSWPALTGATSYKVYRSLVSGGPYQLLSGSVSGTSYSDNTITNGATYYYVVTGNLPEGESSQSPERSVLTPPAIVVQPQSVSVPEGGTFNLSVVAVGQGTLTYQWRKDGANIGGATSASYSKSNTAISDGGAYDVVVANAAGSVTSSVATVTVLLVPVITQQPQAQYYFAEASFGGFSIQARGQTPLTFIWQKLVDTAWQNVTSEAPASNAFARLSWTAADSGQYRAIITNDLGAATSTVANVTVVLPVSITTPPQGAVVGVGGSHTFTVAATGNLLTYQWYKDGQLVSGATNVSFTLNNIQITNEGNYSVVVANNFFSQTSSVAFLDVKFAPIITTQPANQTTIIGGSATFTVAVNADPPASFQWQLNGIDIPGATSATLVINNANMQNVGRYSVVAMNDRGATTSSAATLQVNYPAPTFFDPFNTEAGFKSTYHTNAGNFNWVNTGGVSNSPSLDLPNNADGSATLTNRSFNFSRAGKVIGVTMMVKFKTAGGSGNPQRILQLGLVQGPQSRPNADADKQWITLRWDTVANSSPETDFRFQNKESTDTTVVDGIVVNRNRPLNNRWYRVVVWFENVDNYNIRVTGHVWDYGADGLVPGRMVHYFAPMLIPNTVIARDPDVFVSFRGNNDTGTDNLDDLAIYEDYRPLPLISSAPLSQTVTPGTLATFRVGLEGSLLASPSLQWYANGVAIPGATNIIYTTPPANAAMNGTLYYVVASSPYGSVTSSVARLTVQGTDTTGPTLVSAGAAGRHLATVVFSETVTKATAENPANYTVTGASVGKATLLDDYRTVRLDLLTALPSTTFSVTAANIADASGNVGGGTVAGTGWDWNYLGTNIGYPLVYGNVEAAPAPNAIDFSAGGADVWGNSDQGYFFLIPRKGDFDIVVRVEEIVRAPETLIMEAQNSSDLAKFGLTARDDLYSAAPWVTVHPFPPATSLLWQGLNRFEAGRRATPAEGAATIHSATTPVVTFPNCWIRLRRAGDTFTPYASTNGVTWTVLTGSYTKSSPETMWVGLFGTVHYNANWYMGKASGRFRDFGEFTYPGATVTITTDLAASASVADSNTLALTVAATATVAPASELRYIWQRAEPGSSSFVTIPGVASTSASYTTPTLRYWSDHGARYRCIVQVPGAQAISRELVVNMTDSTAPTVSSVVVAPGSTNSLLVTFSEGMSLSALTNIASYLVVDAGNTPLTVLKAEPYGNNTRVVLTVNAALIAGANYNVTFINMTDAANNPLAEVTRSVTAPNYASNPILFEMWQNVPNYGGRLQDLIYHPRVLGGAVDVLYYTNAPVFNFPNFIDSTLNNYGARVRGYFVPQSSGLYRFWIKSDDGSRMFMNTNAVNSWDPADAVLIAYSSGSSGTNYGTGNRYQLGGINMVAGQRYYFEFIHAEGTGGDGFGIAYTINSTTTPASDSFIPASLFEAPLGPVRVQEITPAMPLTYAGRVVLKARGIQGAGPYIMQWYRNGVPIPGASGRGYTLEINATPADAGTVYTYVISNAFSRAEASVTIAFAEDPTPLQIVRIRSEATMDGAIIEFNRPLDPASVYTPNAIQVGGGLPVYGWRLRTDGRAIFVATGPQSEYTTYPLTLTDIRAAGVNGPSLTVATNFTSHFLVQGFVRVERYDEIGKWDFVAPGTPASGLYLNQKFVDKQPDVVDVRNIFYYAPANLEYYGARVIGWFVPPETGNYAFYVRSDDGSILFVNPTGPAAEGKQVVARVESANVAFNNTVNGNPRYSVAALSAGQRYYVEAVMQEGTGGDYVTAIIRGPNNYYVPSDNSSEPGTSGAYFLMPVAPENRTDVYVLQPPGTVTVAPGQSATLTVMAAGIDTRLPIQYVWQRETAYGSGVFTNIPYALANTYVTPPVSEPTNRFRVMCYTPSGFASAIGTVILSAPDAVGPAIIGASVKVMAREQVRVMFNKALAPATANNTANYRITDGLADVPVVSAALQADGTTVLLTLAQALMPGAAYNVIVNNVTDTVSPANPVPANTSYKFWVPQGYIVRKQYNFTSSNNPGSLSALTNTTVWLNDQPSVIELMTVPDKPTLNIDYYATRFQGYLIPERTGNYTFYIASDDNGELYLSTDENPANIRLICYEPSYGNSRDWTSNAGGRRGINPATGMQANISVPIFLQAGKAYYIEVRHREGSGGDYVAINWKAPGDIDPVNGVISRIGPDNLSGLTPNSFARVTGLPASITTNELATVTLAPQIDGFPLVSIQWRTNGVPVANATNRTYTTPTLSFAAHNGMAVDVVVVTTYNSITSSPTVINVVRDLEAPTLVAAQGGWRGTREFWLRFSEPVSAASAGNTANYLVTNDAGALTVVSAQLMANNRDVLLTLSPLPTEGATYTVVAANIADRAATPNVSGALVTTVTAWTFTTNFVYYERYTNITGSAITDLTNNAKYQARTADITGFTNFVNLGNNLTDALWNNYGAVIRGFFTPQVSGPHVIYVAHDDAVIVRASPDDNPANAVEIINQPCCQGTFADGLRSFTNNLVAGQRYFFEVLGKEGGGGDYFRLAIRPWIDVSDPSYTDPSTLPPLGGSGIGVYAPPSAITITQPPQSANVVAYRSATLSVQAAVNPAPLTEFLAYQWRSNGVNIVGANGPVYTTPILTPDLVAVNYSVVVMAPGAAPVESAVATVTVVADVEPPTIQWAVALDGYQLYVRFNELLETVLYNPADATLYSANNGTINFLSGELLPDGRTVKLTSDSYLATGTELACQMAYDRSQNLAFNLSATIQNYGFRLADIGLGLGQLTGPSVVSMLDLGVFSVNCDGVDIWGTTDGGQLMYRPVTGDFDIRVRVQSLTQANAWTKAGIMARETTNNASFNVYMCSTPRGGQNTFSFQWRDSAVAPNSQSTGDAAIGLVRPPLADYPNNWVRLVRQGNAFSAYYSYDGVNWIWHYTRVSSLARTLLVGLATTSHDMNIRATAVYDNLYFPPPPSLTVDSSLENIQVNLGGSVTLTATIVNPPNSGPLTIKWFKNGVLVPGANSATLQLPNIQVADGGVYVVVAGNHGGETSSQPLVVNVVNQRPVTGADTLTTQANTPVTVPVAQLLANDSDPEGATLNFERVYAGLPRELSYNFNDGLLPVNTMTYGNAYIDAAGGVGNSGVLKLTDPVGSLNGSFVVNDSAISAMAVSEFTIRAKLFIGRGSANAADGMSINFATDLPDGPSPGPAEDGVGSGFGVNIDNYNSGGNEAPAIEVRVGSWLLRYPIAKINMSDYQDLYIRMDADGTVDVALGGVMYFNNVQTPYQPITGGRFGIYARTGGEYEAHYMDDLYILAVPRNTAQGGTVSVAGGQVTYTPPPSACGADTFYYAVNDGQTGSTVYQAVTVIIAETTPVPPVFVTGLQDQTMGAGTNHLLVVPDLRSQVVATDNGCYVVIEQIPAPGSELPLGTHTITMIATDGIGLTATNRANLSVYPTVPPLITVQPTNVTATAGSTVVFTVAAIGGDPALYQWKKDGVNIDGATSATLTLTNVMPASAGVYSVEVRNSVGSTMSQDATLVVTVVLPPTAPNITAPVYGPAGFSFTVETVAGAWYWIEYKNDLNDAQWQRLPAVQGTGGVLTLADPAPAGSKRFYRVAASTTQP
ncbi:MAG: immunoglobulin domain-containing protein [Verrucomicrobiae bacterium]|nr:immunoglobulin domain-containing protein [Verrucomicrobiae bacterium]